MTNHLGGRNCFLIYPLPFHNLYHTSAEAGVTQMIFFIGDGDNSDNHVR